MHVELPLYGVVVAAVLYAAGGRRRVSGAQPWRSAAFYAGLLAIVAAIDTPIDTYAQTLFVAHMAQHVLLIAIAPPLLTFSAPWTRLWHPFPLAVRRPVARTLALSPRLGWLRRTAHFVAHPIFAWTLASATLVVWHIPAAYDLTLRNDTVHQLEHALFFFSALLFWGAAFDSSPFRTRLNWLQRAIYLTAGMLVGWVLALVLAFAHTPLYAAYVSLAHRPGGLSALADQQLAAGIMWVPGSLAYTITAIFCVYRWLDEAPRRARVGLVRGAS